MGTPSEYYRQRARQLYGTNFIARGKYSLELGSGNSAPVIFDPLEKQASHDPLFKKPLLFDLFQALTQDFYQPASIGYLFQKLFVDEKFNPYSSPPRVLQLLKRLNKWFSQRGLPISVEFKKSEFRLVSSTKVILQIQRNTNISAKSAKVIDFKTQFKDRMFSKDEVSIELGVSKMTANRMIKCAIESGILMKEKSRTGRPYVFASKNKRKSA